MTEPTKRQQLEVALERAGAQMANVLFNLAQKPGTAITVEMADMMGNLRRDWDLAFGNLSQAVKLGAAPAPAARPVAVFEGYVDGQPLAKWLGTPPAVGCQLFAAPVATVEATDLTMLRDRLKRAAVDGAPLTLSSSSCSALYYAMTTGQVFDEAARAAPIKERRRFEERG